MSKSTPILYSFRRCPYAMRARLAIAYSQVAVELREVKLASKPQALIDASPKATVPVLVVGQQVIDESLDVMLWALKQKDSRNWWKRQKPAVQQEIMALIRHNDETFKYWLDRYKYADRHPEHSQDYYRQQAESTLAELDIRIGLHGNLVASQLTLADAAILPFIRQFASVDKQWFAQAPYPALRQWLENHCESVWFNSVMEKYEPWQPSNKKKIIFPNEATKSSYAA
ncbi:glutathione S-transferase [Salinibius halmophilus]|uniref:glutathione S-transferase n=1 Tax=Salinibius halmophilus TaxID=1853216 RepID=UPI000E675D5A|nr:glutathione S-transferase [Salinibius halmophilus]